MLAEHGSLYLYFYKEKKNNFDQKKKVDKKQIELAYLATKNTTTATTYTHTQHKKLEYNFL